MKAAVPLPNNNNTLYQNARIAWLKITLLGQFISKKIEVFMQSQSVANVSIVMTWP